MGQSALVTRQQLATLFRCSPRWINELCERGMPRAAAGKYDLIRCFRWYASHLRKKSGSGVDVATIIRDKIKTNTIRAEREEFELSQVRSHLVVVAALTTVKQQFHRFYREHMWKIVDLALDRLTGLENRAVIEAAVGDAVSEAFAQALAAPIVVLAEDGDGTKG